MRKGSTEMWWIIIGAVIALIVVIILLVMFTGKTRDLEEGATECGGKGGICAVRSTDATVENCPANTLEASTFSCSANEVCCIGIPKKCTAAGDQTTCGKDKAGKVIACKLFGKNHYCS